MSRRLVVYVAGPLGKPEAWAQNVANAIAAGVEVANAGHAPIVPHLFVALDEVHPRTHAEWMEIDLAIVAKCDVVLRLPGASPGADMEVEHAKCFAGVRVVYAVADL